MKLILLQKVTNLGGLGDLVDVKPGYGRNFLVPQGKAVPATEANVAAFEAKRAEYEAKAQAILAINQATAEGLKLLNEAAPTEPIVQLKALEAFQAAANGRATKIIIPSEIQGLAGLATAFKEVIADPKAPAAPAEKK